MSSRPFLSRIVFALVLAACGSARAQEVPGADPNAPAPPPPGVDKYYWDLAQSKDPKDRLVKSHAERYLNLVKVQEWSDLSGKFRTIARYVKHDPNLTTVTIESVKGRGAERTTKEVTVPVDKLSKNCQSRVKQIDTMQKKIKEMAPPKPGENGVLAGVPGEVPGGELASAPGPEGGPSAPMPQPPTAPEPDPSASEPDPLGFAEVELTPPVPPGPPGGEGLPPGGEQPPVTPN
jgi:hypothetical protein